MAPPPRCTKPDLLTHEITPFFPFLMFDFFLGCLYDFTIYLDMCPTKLGYPVRRSRQYAVGHRRSTLISTGSPQHFWSLFERSLKVSASVFFVAPKEEIAVHHKRLAAARRIEYQDRRQEHRVSVLGQLIGGRLEHCPRSADWPARFCPCMEGSLEKVCVQLVI